MVERDAFEHPLLRDAENFRAWFWLVAHAAWRPTPFDVNGKIITLARGQLSCSVRGLAKEWRWSKSAAERFLARLKTETMIETQSETGRMIVTICNYSKYQDVRENIGTPSGTLTGTRAGQQRDTKEPLNHLTIPTREPNGSLPPTPQGGDDELFSRPEPTKVYAFAGRVIRLNQPDFDRWVKAYPAIDLAAALQGRDDWLSGQDEAIRKKWFQSTSSFLARMQQERAAAKRDDDRPRMQVPC